MTLAERVYLHQLAAKEASDNLADYYAMKIAADVAAAEEAAPGVIAKLKAMLSGAGEKVKGWYNGGKEFAKNKYGAGKAAVAAQYGKAKDIAMKHPKSSLALLAALSAAGGAGADEAIRSLLPKKSRGQRLKEALFD